MPAAVAGPPLPEPARAAGSPATLTRVVAAPVPCTRTTVLSDMTTGSPVTGSTATPLMWSKPLESTVVTVGGDGAPAACAEAEAATGANPATRVRTRRRCSAARPGTCSLPVGLVMAAPSNESTDACRLAGRYRSQTSRTVDHVPPGRPAALQREDRSGGGSERGWIGADG